MTTRASLYNHRLPPVVCVFGPAGTGKSLLARRAAVMISRSESGPSVLLVDADLYNRGLTALLESVVEPASAYLHDVLVGGNPRVQPVDITTLPLGGGDERPPREEGRIFMLPSIRRAATNPLVGLASAELSLLRELIVSALTSAVESCGAGCVVLDTAPIPEPCGAIMASLSDLRLAVGSRSRPAEMVEDHARRLAEFEPSLAALPVHRVFNLLEPTDVAALPPALEGAVCVIPELFGVQKNASPPSADMLADLFELDTRISVLLRQTFRLQHPALVPSWWAPFPSPWRKLARDLRKQPPRLLPPLLRRLAIGLAIGIPAGTCLIAALVFRAATPTSAQALPVLQLALLSVGAVFAILSLSVLLRAVIDYWSSRRAAELLATGESSWALRTLRLSPRDTRRLTPERRARKKQRKLTALQRRLGLLSRAVEDPTR